MVDAPHRVVRSDREAVGARTDVALAPRPDETPVALVDEDGVLRAAQEVDASSRINRDSGDVGVREARWKLLPAFDDGILDLLVHAALPGRFGWWTV